MKQCNLMRRKQSHFQKGIYLPSRELKNSPFDDNLRAATRDNERRGINECLEESFLVEIHFLMRNDDLRKVAGNWTWPETGPHTVLPEFQICF